MKKQEFIEAVALAIDCSNKKSKEVIESIEKLIFDTVKSGDSVTFAGAEFGKKEVKGRSGVMKKKNEDGSTTEIPWTTETHMEGYAKAKSVLKDLK